MLDSFFLRRRGKKNITPNNEIPNNETLNSEIPNNELSLSFKTNQIIDDTDSQTTINSVTCTQPLILPQRPLTNTICHNSIVTIFGFSQSNKSEIIKMINEVDDLLFLNHSKNSLIFSFKNNKNNEMVLNWNKRIINDEMIGVFLNKPVIREIVKKQSIFNIIWEYFFGSRKQNQE
ncbi:hypothetical protein M153_7344000560 [Pseudoloma neurophilia]|uniref:Uncharacterized protein n=1 Tax=Pseudoloma neurophilia TaxID=146866 RepID=A0A0R0M0U4_9MICR|nr:hypothetical protein M153_7344000560 [Pseudoloma neurophilia]